MKSIKISDTLDGFVMIGWVLGVVVLTGEPIEVFSSMRHWSITYIDSLWFGKLTFVVFGFALYASWLDIHAAQCRGIKKLLTHNGVVNLLMCVGIALFMFKANLVNYEFALKKDLNTASSVVAEYYGGKDNNAFSSHVIEPASITSESFDDLNTSIVKRMNVSIKDKTWRNAYPILEKFLADYS